MRIIVKYFALIWCSLLILPLSGQRVPAPRVKYITLNNHYSNQTIRDIYKDKVGVIWVSTGAGLYWYDGISIGQYSTINGNNIPTGQIQCVVEDDNEVLWINTALGLRFLSKDRRKTLPYSEIGIPLSIYNSKDISICQGRQKEILLRTGNQFYSYRNHSLQLLFKIPPLPILQDKLTMVYSLKNALVYVYSYSEDIFWIIDLFGNIKNNPPIYSTDGRLVLPKVSNQVKTITSCFGDSVSIIDQSQGQYLLNYQSDKNILVKTERFNLKNIPKINELLRQINQFCGSDSSNLSLHKYYRLNDQLYAIGTSIGFFLLSPSQQLFNHIPGSLGHKIRPIQADKHGRLIFGSNKGIFSYTPKNNKIKAVRPNPTMPWSICKIGNTSTYIIDGEDYAKRWYHIRSDFHNIYVERIDSSLTNNQLSFARVAVFDKYRNGIWHERPVSNGIQLVFYGVVSGTHHVVYHFDTQTNHRSILVQENNLWLGSETGVLRLGIDNEASSPTLSNFTESIPTAISTLSTNCLYADTVGNIWIGTNGQGLLRYHPQSLESEYFTTTDGLVENTIYSIISEQSDSVLWIGTANGLSRFDVKNKWFDNYYTEDGLCHNEFNTASVFRSENGTIYMGGQNGINYFNPDHFRTQNSPIKQYITVSLTTNTRESKVNQIIASPNDVITIPPSYKLIILSFHADDYLHAEQLHYRYRIPGELDDWQYINHSDKALFPKLPASTLILEVQVQTYRGMWSPVANYVLNVLPPWYATWWFRTLVLLGIGSILYGLYLLRIRFLHREFNLRQQISHDLHDDLGSRIYLLRALSHQIINPLTSEQKKKEQLEQFEGISQDTFKSIRDFIWAFDPKQDEVTQMFDRMDDFAENYLSPLITKVEIIHSDIPENIKIGPRLKYHLMNIYQELLTNMVKHTYCDSLRITLNYQDYALIIQLQNRHKGYRSESNTNSDFFSGQGLNSIRNRAKEINGTLVIQEPREFDQIVELRVPL